MRSAIILLVIFTSLSVKAQLSTSIQSGAKLALIKEGSVRRVLPGRPEGKITNEYHFTVAWKTNQAPGSFVFYYENNWIPCGVAKNQQNVQDLKTIKKGDVLEITPYIGSRLTGPLSFKKFKPTDNTIAFKVKNNWYHITTKSLTKKPDLALP